MIAVACKHKGFWTFDAYGQYHCCECGAQITGPNVLTLNRAVQRVETMTHDELVKLYGDAKEHRDRNMAAVYLEVVEFLGFKKKPWYIRLWQKTKARFPRP